MGTPWSLHSSPASCVHVHVRLAKDLREAPPARLPGRQTAGSELGEKEEAEAHLSGCR